MKTLNSNIGYKVVRKASDEYKTLMESYINCNKANGMLFIFAAALTATQTAITVFNKVAPSELVIDNKESIINIANDILFGINEYFVLDVNLAKVEVANILSRAYPEFDTTHRRIYTYDDIFGIDSGYDDKAMKNVIDNDGYTFSNALMSISALFSINISTVFIEGDNIYTNIDGDTL